VLAGRFGQAEALIAEGQAIGERAGDQGVTIFAQAVVNVMSYQQGRFAERAEPLGAFLRRFPALPVLRAVLTAALAVGGQADAARPELAALVADDLAALPRDLTFGYSLGLLAVACHALGERPAAERVQRLLLPYAERRPGDRDHPVRGRLHRPGRLLPGAAGRHPGPLGRGGRPPGTGGGPEPADGRGGGAG